MDRERLFRNLEQRYTSKRDMIARIPLGTQADAIWQELLNRRRSNSTVLPISGRLGSPYWYVTTEKMVAASEKIVETLLENENEFDPYTEAPAVSTLEEVFYTSYVDGSQMTMQEAMAFLQSESPPRDVEELMIVNNRQAGNFASANLYRPVDEAFLQDLAYILTEGLDEGSHEFRKTDWVDFASADGEPFAFPTAQAIPDRVKELTAFLADSKTHPLIKAAVAQAWVMVIRPFPEGNERLGRILSSVILLRAGYAFFSDISLSALIARKGYGYYEAIANILREENGGDLTYFVEYFLELLSRAIDERRLRMSRKEEQNLAAEVEMAKAPLQSRVAQSPLQGEVADDPFPPDNEEDMDAGTPMEKLLRYAENPNRVIGAVSIILLQKLEEGINHVVTAELAKEMNLASRQLSSSIRFLKLNGILKESKRIKHKRAYVIISEDPAVIFAAQENKGDHPDQEIIGRIQTLAHSKSQKDRRIASMMVEFMDKGEVALSDYEERGQGSRWSTDMQFAMQLGLVEKITPQRYRLLREFKNESPVLSKAQKRIITDLYESFGEETFSIEMVVATLDYSGAHASAVLHQFTLLRLIDCQTGEFNQYQFLVNPQDNPECFAPAA